MQQASSTTKTVIIFIAILVIGAIIYFYTLGGATDSSISSLDQQSAAGNTETQIAGARVLSLLGQMRALKIDNKFFDDPFYQSLNEHTVVIPDQNIGRVNPFEPFGYQPVAQIPVPVIPVKAPAVVKVKR